MTNIRKHDDYDFETERLDKTKDYIKDVIGTVINKRIRFKEDIKDAYINLDYLDSSLSYSSIMLNTNLLDNLERNFDLLVKSKEKPYFARIDIKQEDKDKTEKVYIGKISLVDDNMDMPMVVDWRAPIASVYYDGRLGKTSYEAVGNKQEIELLMKRQYEIEDGKLENFMDVDISTTDTFLQASLDGHAGDKLKDIVSTIQGEQNQIIRADIEKPLIVQGAAGSGKTTIALHRLAYLLYTYSDTFDSEDFMIIGPNNLFLDYISNVLPELGADNIKQSTYVDFMFELIGYKYKVTDSNKKLNELIRTDSKALKYSEKEMVIKSSKLKNSMEMKNLLDSFINNVEKRILPDEDYTIEGFSILSSSEISDLYYESYGYQPILKRIESIKKYLKEYTKNSIKDILKKINYKYTEELRLLREDPEDSPEKKLKMIGLMEEREGTLKKAEKNAKKAADKFIKKFKKNNLLGFYKEFISNFNEYYSEDSNLGKYISKETKKLINKKTLEIEDLASVVYLKDRFFGINEDLDIKVAVIDEAQDFSEFQFFVLHRVLDTERFTILGDLSQGIHMYRAVENWDYIKDSIFNEDVNYLTLEQSYRTTIEIMNLANEVLSQTDTNQLIKAKPVVRHGEEPVIQELREDKKITSNIIKQLDKWDNDSLTTVAIVTKSNEEAKKIFGEITALNKSLDIELVDENSEHFNHKILVIPAHLSKGLEFDGVIITTLNEDYTFEPLDTKLLYVAMTRAMHRLAIYCKKDSIPHIKDENTGKIAV